VKNKFKLSLILWAMQAKQSKSRILMSIFVHWNLFIQNMSQNPCF